MLNLLFFILMIIVFGKILGFAIKAAWGASKIVCSVILLPIFLIGLVIKGLLSIAFPVLLVVGILAVVALHD